MFSAAETNYSLHHSIVSKVQGDDSASGINPLCFCPLFQMKTFLTFEDNIHERFYATKYWDKQGRTSLCEPWEFLALVTLINNRLYLLSFPLKQTSLCSRKRKYWILPFKLLILFCILLCRQLLLVTSVYRNRKSRKILPFKCSFSFL